MTVDVTAAMRDFWEKFFGDEGFALNFFQDPQGTTVAQGLTEGDFTEVDMHEMIGGCHGAPADYGDGAPPAHVQPGQDPFALLLQHATYAAQAVYQENPQIINQVNQQTTVVDNSVSVDVSDVEGDVTIGNIDSSNETDTSNDADNTIGDPNEAPDDGYGKGDDGDKPGDMGGEGEPGDEDKPGDKPGDEDGDGEGGGSPGIDPSWGKIDDPGKVLDPNLPGSGDDDGGEGGGGWDGGLPPWRDPVDPGGVFDPDLGGGDGGGDDGGGGGLPPVPPKQDPFPGGPGDEGVGDFDPHQL